MLIAALWTSHPQCMPPGPVSWQLSLSVITALGPPQITWNKFERAEVLLEPEKYCFVTRLRIKYRSEADVLSLTDVQQLCID